MGAFRTASLVKLVVCFCLGAVLSNMAGHFDDPGARQHIAAQKTRNQVVSGDLSDSHSATFSKPAKSNVDLL